MLKAFQVQDHVLNELNFEFKELLFANIANRLPNAFTDY